MHNVLNLQKKTMKRQIPEEFILALVLFPLAQLAWSNDTLLCGHNITEGQSLISPRGLYELGFFSPGSSTKHFLGIWFSMLPDVVVWVANRDNPLNTSGTLTVNKKGSLVLYDSSQKIVWSSGTNSTSLPTNFCPILQLQDSGNLILGYQASNTIMWQSFDFPTNSLLPGMKIGKNLITGTEMMLSSWKSDADPSVGQYTAKMDTNGYPELVVLNQDKIMTRNVFWNGIHVSSSIPMLTFLWDNYEVSFEYDMYTFSLLSRVVLNDDGTIQLLVLNDKTWYLFWSSPSDECDYFARCGNFGICQPHSTIICSCLRGFEVETPTEWNMGNYSGGCKRRTELGCSDNSDGFYELNGVKMPYSNNATVYFNLSVDECRTRCLMNCSCLAYASSYISGRGSGCVTWNTELVDLKYVDGGLDVLYLKVSKSEIGTGNKKKVVIIGTVSSLTISMLLICLVCYLLSRKKTQRSSKQEIAELLPLQNDSFNGTADHPVFDIEIILQATDNFSTRNVVGHGGFGIVYKGKLSCGQEIAVKRLSKNSSQGSNEFINEVTLIAKLQHRNLVKLLGWCIENNERILVYEFMTNKSLDSFIFNPEKRASLSWTTKFKIARGIARGLLYLHHDSRFNVIHRDLKAANVLLDEEMNPKISDFGTARLFQREQAVISTETVIGTRGYMSPEYISEGKFSIKSDVYSFGVLILEIMSGIRNQGNQSLIAYVWKLWEEQNISQLLDEEVHSSVLTTELPRCINVGLLCVQDCPDDRPSMSSVCMMLSSDSLKLPAPKKPLICRSTDEMITTGSHCPVSANQLTITSTEGR